MALITCPNCGKQVSDQAAKCPHCGLDLATLSSRSEVNASGSEATTKPIEKQRKKWPIFVIIGLCLAVAFAALWFYVLNDSKTNEKKSAENIETRKDTDSSTPDDMYLTQDLRMWGLFGPVKDFHTTVSRIDGPSRWDEETLHYYDEETLYEGFSASVQFDEQGHFVNTIDGKEYGFTIDEIANKDEDRILVAKSYTGEMDGYATKQWSYYPNGKVKQMEINGYENQEKCQYFYNEAGELSKTEEIGSSEGEGWKIITVYSIKDRDEYGNWTQRIAEVSLYEIIDWNNEVYKQNAVLHEMYNRTIRYYGQESSTKYVVINGSELRLRLGPSTSADTFKWADGTNRHPNKGEKYLYLGESGDFYKIDYKGHEVWVSKQYTYLE